MANTIVTLSSIYNGFVRVRVLQHHLKPDKRPSGPVWVMYSYAKDLLLTNDVVNATVSGSGMSK